MGQPINISIDLGAKNTGLLVEHNKLTHGYAIINDLDNITYAQSERRVARHTRRNYQRRRLAKRLLPIILNDLLGINIVKTVPEVQNFLYGLLNRRGYFHTDTSDLDPDELENSSPWEEIPKDFTADIASYANFIDKYKSDTQYQSKVDRIIDNLKLKKDKKQNKTILKPYKSIIEIIDAIKTLEKGSKHRSEYFKNIKDDINSSQLLNEFDKKQKDDIYRVIANISNLQLRDMRRYFSRSPKSTKITKENNLIKSINQNISSKKDRHKNIKTEYKDFFMQDPDNSVPEFEDMDNRNTQIDTTLFLSADRLTKNFPAWKSILAELKKQDEVLLIGADEIAKIDKKKLDSDAIILQRFMDRSDAHDKINIRYLALSINDKKSKLTTSYKHAEEELKKILNETQYTSFIDFANKYYSEIALAKQGLYNHDNQYNFLLPLNRKCQKKHKSKDIFISNILRVNISSIVDDFSKMVKDETIKLDFKNQREKKIISIMSDCSKAVKKYSERLPRILQLSDQDMEHKSKDIYYLKLKANKTAERIKKFIKEKLDKDIDEKKIHSIYSMSQLFSFIDDQQIKGYAKLSKISAIEAGFRDAMDPTDNGKQVARCSKLSTDSVRPFNGQLGRILERLAVVITHKALDTLVDKNDWDKNINILIEDNKFRFKYELSEYQREITKNKKYETKKEDLQTENEQQNKEFQDKFNRVKSSNQYCCPYTGENIITGEIDHIIPRSYSMKKFKVIFNSECNLIYSSKSGNNLKSDKAYTLADLHINYLEKVFHTSDIEHIADKIDKSVKTIMEQYKGQNIQFHSLSEDEQKYLRHALFLINNPTPPEWSKDLIFLLNTKMTTLVNGTQKYLAKLITQRFNLLFATSQNGLNTSNKPIISINLIPSEDINQRREQLKLIDKNKYQKHDLATGMQKPMSHVIDAAIGLDIAVKNKLIKYSDYYDTLIDDLLPKTINFEFIKSKTSIERYYETIDRLEKKELSDKQIKSAALKAATTKTLFKGSLYAEKFLPIIITADKEIRIGFSIPNSAKHKDKDNILTDDFLKFLEYKGKKITSLNEINQLLQENKFIVLNIIKAGAISHLHKCSVAGKFDKSANGLLKLQYKTIKTNINILAKEGVDKIEKGCTLMYNKQEIYIPAKDNWDRVNKAYEDQLKTTAKSDTNFWSLVAKNSAIFIKSIVSDRKHKKAHNVFSLPLLHDNGNIRIRRTDRTGKVIFQLTHTEGYKNSGFKLQDNQVDFKKISTNEVLFKSENISFTKDEKLSFDTIEKFGTTRIITLPQVDYVTEIKMGLATSDRPNIAIKLSWQNFKENILDSLEVNNINNPFDLPASCKVKESFINQTSLPKPRNKIRFLAFGDEIIFDYVTNEYNSALKEAYNNAVSDIKKD